MNRRDFLEAPWLSPHPATSPPNKNTGYTDFIIRDSGQRKQFASGMNRDTQEGKRRLDLIYWPLVRRWADHMTTGAEKYGDNNWKLAESVEEALRFRASLLRHLDQYLAGETDEDHQSAIVFGLAGLQYLREEKGVELPPL